MQNTTEMTVDQLRSVVQEIRGDINDCVDRLDNIAGDYHRIGYNGAYRDMKDAAMKIEDISRTFLFHWGVFNAEE